MQALEDDALKAAVAAAYAGAELELPEAASLSEAAGLARGSVRHALQLLSDGGIALYGKLAGALRSLPRLDYGAVHGLADTISSRQSEAEFEMFFTLLEDSLARMVHQAATGTGARPGEAELAERLIPAHGLARWAELWEEVRRAKADALALNLDRKSLVLGAFFRIEETARSTAR
jgi:DNA polymerase-3 subunit delta'